ncbi:ATP-binding protein [Halobacterium litoreum]|uniref:ATP-binding protein n=1 Tax=Halobacterium litoreum TaxID=2039234 RepID=A0ABD5NEN5_9EURY|nr:ATP-binding protein [Halobacterium litoreum]UHH13393.1 ATP-binding protein [Halobacterium litoreum]
MNLFIGENLDEHGDTYIDASSARSILACGKRGTGKSYTMGSIVEEIHTETDDIVPLVIDPMGIYWTMAEENDRQRDLLWDWGMSEEGFPVNLLVPGNPGERFGDEVLRELEGRGIDVNPLLLNPSDMTPDGWCDLFDLNINKPMGIALYRSVRELNEEESEFYLDDIIQKVERDGGSSDRTKEALLNRLEMAKDWGIFADQYQDLWRTFDENRINVLDMSVIDPGQYGLRNLVVEVLGKELFRQRQEARRREEMGLSVEIPKVWLFIDEAHNFVPSGSSSLAKDTIIRWVKEGRQPGLSIVVATQQPSAIDSDVLSQCDIILCHKITTKEDIQSLDKLSQDYMGSDLKTYVRQIDNVGEVVYVDDDEETVEMVKMRPRQSKHGGGEA